MIGRYIQSASSLFQNVLSNIQGVKLTYIIDGRSWVIGEIGRSITQELTLAHGVRSQVSYDAVGLRNQIVHFGSANHFFIDGGKRGWKKPHKSNTFILTWFHVAPGDQRLSLMKKAQESLACIHTSCLSTKETLVNAGVDPQKIIVIPLGIDLERFFSVDASEQKACRERLGIPTDRHVIGSFQKDGEGWGDGMEPKLVKGPDIFVDTIIGLKDLNPFVLLTGPSRGYVKKRLADNGIEYKHVYVKDFSEIPSMYHALDMYLISSRVEGGPMAILESWASGVPLVSTRVGMVPDIATVGEDCLLADVDDTVALVSLARKLLQDKTRREKLQVQGSERVKSFSWKHIVQRHLQELYNEV